MITVTRTSLNGQTYTDNPAALVDGNPATVVDLYATQSSFVSDYLRIDLGETLSIAGVTLRNVTVPVSPTGHVTVCAVPTEDANQGGGETGSDYETLLPVGQAAAGSDITINYPGPVDARYLMVTLNTEGGDAMGSVGELALVDGQPPSAPRNLAATIAY